MPTNVPLLVTTGNPLIRLVSINRAASAMDADGSIAITGVVIMS